MKKGWFITFEGPDGAGKTTQMTRLTAYLRERGLDVLVTREPGGTPIGEQIRHLLLDPGNGAMDPVTETLLYAASRAQHVREVIGPALAAGRVVVCDRFFDSSLAYQAYGRGLGERMVRDINGPAMGDSAPDATICMLARPETSRRRLSRKDNALDRLENEERIFSTACTRDTWRWPALTPAAFCCWTPTGARRTTRGRSGRKSTRCSLELTGNAFENPGRARSLHNDEKQVIINKNERLTFHRMGVFP
jgi:dTMP kinase